MVRQRFFILLHRSVFGLEGKGFVKEHVQVCQTGQVCTVELMMRMTVERSVKQLLGVSEDLERYFVLVLEHDQELSVADVEADGLRQRVNVEVQWDCT